jgi:hypothetical protein
LRSGSPPERERVREAPRSPPLSRPRLPLSREAPLRLVALLLPLEDDDPPPW